MKWFKKLWNWIKDAFEGADDDVLVPMPPEPVPVPVPTTPPPASSGTWAKIPLVPFQIFHFDSFSDFLSKIKATTRLVNLEYDQITQQVVDICHKRGILVCAYMSASYEEWRDDAAQYPKDAKGKKMDDWDECWGNITKVSLQDFLAKRMDLVRDMGCDAIEIDNIDVAFNDVGFKVTPEQNLAAIFMLAGLAHVRGMAFMAKNTPNLCADYAQFVDGAFVESAQEYDEEGDFDPLVAAGKPVYGLEYSGLPKELDGWFINKQSGYFDETPKEIYAAQ